MTNDPWRYRCPMGHANIKDSARTQERYFCGVCKETHDHGPYDAAEWSFPVLNPDERRDTANSKAVQRLLKAGKKA